MHWKEFMREGLGNWISICSDEQEFDPIRKQLEDLQSDLEDEITVLVAGEFNAGKSTFINALLGKEVLSSDVTPETAMVTKMKYGEERKVIAHYLNGHSKVYNDTWLEQLTTERDGRFKEIRRMLSHVELQLPIEILKTFTIIDTPGLNANNQYHTMATERFLERTDHAIFLFHALNIGTAIDIKWLKRFHEHGIQPFGIINRIDEIDEEEDDLESIIDFNRPRLGNSVQTIMGVSARDALNGKLQNNLQLLDWSNWEVVENLFESLRVHGDKKLERTYSRLLQPIRQWDEMILRRKQSLQVRKLKREKIDSFINREFPLLLSIRERLNDLRQEAKSVHDEWHSLLKQIIYSVDSFDEFLRGFMEIVHRLDEQRRSKLINNPLKIWEEEGQKLFHYFNGKRQEYNKAVVDSTQFREELEQNWKVLQNDFFFRKITSLEMHRQQVENYHEQLEELTEKRRQLKELFNLVTEKIGMIGTSIKTFIESDIGTFLENEEKELESWNRQLLKVKEPFSEITEKDLDHIESFAKQLNAFQEKVALPLLRAGSNYSAAYSEASYLLENIGKIGSDLPSKEFYSQWRTLQSFVLEMERPYDIHFPHVTPSTLMNHELKDIPEKLTHQINAEISKVISIRNRYLKNSAMAILAMFIIGSISYGVYTYSGYSASAYKSSDYMEEDVDTESVEPSLEEDRAQLEALFPRQDVESFIRSIYQELYDNESNHTHLFYPEAWQSFSPYYTELYNGELTGVEITSIQYLSGNEISVTVKETTNQLGFIKEYETSYTLTSDPYSTNTLVVSSFTYELMNETETEIPTEDWEIEAFLGDFRSAYMQSLNEGDFGYISPFFDKDSSAYQELQKFISSVAGKGYSFDEFSLQVNSIEKVKINQYSVSTFETFVFTDDKNEKTHYARTKVYTVNVLPEKELLIKEIMITKTEKEVIKIPTVQLVSNEDIWGFIVNYYSAFVYAFNGDGFSYVQDYFDPEGQGYRSTEDYIKNANNKNMNMVNLEIEVESIEQVDENHYLVTVYFVDEYSYQDGTGDQKHVRGQYKIRITDEGYMMITDQPIIEVIEEIEF